MKHNAVPAYLVSSYCEKFPTVSSNQISVGVRRMERRGGMSHMTGRLLSYAYDLTSRVSELCHWEGEVVPEPWYGPCHYLTNHHLITVGNCGVSYPEAEPMPLMCYLLVLLLLFFCLYTSADEVSDALSATPTATIGAGRIIGTTTAIGPTGSSIAVNKFLGIPYAAPPTNENRFRPPQPPAPWQTRDTKQFSASCPQVFVQSPVSSRDFTRAVFNNPAPAESEDCLYLNVFAPRKAWDPAHPPYPVLFWMYGGGWQFGNAGQPWYDGSYFAALEDVVVVSVNYRTNAFGLPIAPTITNLTERNLAVLDQRAGLQWVQENIRYFGGDASRVTIFGQSAGAYAVDLLITSYAPTAPRPFRAAIMQSGNYAYIPAVLCDPAGYYSWNALAAELNCTGTDAQKFTCIKSQPWQNITAAQERNYTIGFGHACDNVTVVSDPRTRLEAGNVANVPVILGTDTADGSFYTIQFVFNTDGYFQTYFPGNPGLRDRALAQYPIGSEGRTDAQYQLQQIHTDWFFHCPAVWYANTYTARNPTYRYLFNATFTNTRAQYSNWPAAYQGAYHTSEIPIAFTSYDKSTEEASERDLSNLMRRAWANFARDPTSPPLSDWPRATQAEGDADVMGFGTDGKGGHGPVVDVHKCRFWEQEGFRTIHA
ncbi:alpha/beta-hydrolase [Westerdykella ornata]|uniref:Carboxylic ester hydrolase n=1 Tax=Westerdykella ornata TaxID=318751 RepID=A0A6A6JPE4_WESOR|nr:alpha/beta-hydrolase [Westerdykella ornata]KAF2278013.1 alpha/beta-hydrolase [Westerdykella ornata]